MQIRVIITVIAPEPPSVLRLPHFNYTSSSLSLDYFPFFHPYSIFWLFFFLLFVLIFWSYYQASSVPLIHNNKPSLWTVLSCYKIKFQKFLKSLKFTLVMRVAMTFLFLMSVICKTRVGPSGMIRTAKKPDPGRIRSRPMFISMGIFWIVGKEWAWSKRRWKRNTNGEKT